jgi:tetratricopeptide (TPR) repeat protein
MHNSTDPLLDEIEAALRLRITVDLLFKYARYAPKKSLGNTQRLTYEAGPAGAGFRTRVLDAWDTYLKEPWAGPGDERPIVPAYVERHLDVEGGGRCAWCHSGHKLETAHIDGYALSRSHYHHNLIRLCADCHTKYDDGLILRNDMVRRKTELNNRLSRQLELDTHAQRLRPFRPPNPDANFVGRAAIVHELADHLRKHRVISVEGAGGIGKTQVALQAVALSVQTPIVWIDVATYSSAFDLHIAVSTALTEHGFPAAQKLPDSLQYASLLLIFDGVEHLANTSSKDVTAFFSDLISYTHTPQFLFTSQVSLRAIAPAATVSVPPLNENESRRVLTSAHWARLAIDVESQSLEEILTFCDGHPLCLRLAVQLIDHYESTNEVARRIRHAGTNVLAQPGRQQHTHTSSVQTCLNVAIDALGTDENILLFLISCFPGGCSTHWLLLPREDVGDDPIATVAELRRWNLVTREAHTDGLTRYHMLSPIRHHLQYTVRDRHPDAYRQIRLEIAEQMAVEAAVLDSFVESPAKSERGLTRLECELSNYLDALELSRDALATGGPDAYIKRHLRVVAALPHLLATFLFAKGLLTVGVRVLRIGIAACKQMGDHEDAALLYAFLFTLYHRQHDFDAVLSVAAELAELGSQTGTPRINALAALAHGHAEIRDPNLARQHYEIAVNIYRTNLGISGTASEDRSGMLGVALLALGEAHLALRDIVQALKTYEEALQVLRDVPHPTNLGTSHHQIGNCHANAGNYDAAWASYLRAAESFFQTGVSDFLSNSLSEMGLLIGTWPSSNSHIDALPKEMLTRGLSDVTSCMLQWDFRKEASFKQIVRKLLGVAALMACSSSGMPPEPELAQLRTLTHGILVDSPASGWAKHLLASTVDLVSDVAASDNAFEPARQSGVIALIADRCFSIEHDTGENLRPAEWVSRWLRRHGEMLSADDLRAMGDPWC